MESRTHSHLSFLVLAVALVLGVCPARASVFTYTTSGSWSNPVTWGGTSGGPVPGEGDTVRINGAASLNIYEDHTIAQWTAGGVSPKSLLNAGASAAILRVTGTMEFTQAGSTFRSFPGAGGLTLDLNTLLLSGGSTVNFGNTTTRIEKVLASGSTLIAGSSALNVVASTTESQFSDVEVNGAFRVYNHNNATSGGVSVRSLQGTGTTSASSSGSDTVGTLTINGVSGTTTYLGSLTNGSLGATLNVVKSGSGAQIFAGVADYSGVTTVSAGTLIINGDHSTATGAVTVAAGATLAGSGTVGGATAISGRHNPGNSPGVQTFSGGLTYNNGSVVGWELIENTEGGRGTNFDGINVSGGLTINGTASIDLVFNGAGSEVVWEDSFWGTNHSWLLYDSATIPTGAFTLGTVSADSLGNVLDAERGAFAIEASGNDIFVTYTAAVPEPSTGGLLGFLAIALIGWRIRRRAARLSA